MQSSEPPDMAHLNYSLPPSDPTLVEIGGLTIRTTNYTKQELRDYINWQAGINDERIKSALATIEKARSENEEFRYFLDRVENNEFWLKRPTKRMYTKGSSGRAYTEHQSNFNQYAHPALPRTVIFGNTVIDTSVPPPEIPVANNSEKVTQSNTTSNVEDTASEPKQLEQKNLDSTITSEALPVIQQVENEINQLDFDSSVHPTIPLVTSPIVSEPEQPQPSIMPAISDFVREPEHLESENNLNPTKPEIIPVIMPDNPHVDSKQKPETFVDQTESKMSPVAVPLMDLDLSFIAESIPDSPDTFFETKSTASEPIRSRRISSSKKSQSIKTRQDPNERKPKAKQLTLADYLSADVRSSINSQSTSGDVQERDISAPMEKTTLDIDMTISVPKSCWKGNILNRNNPYDPSNGKSFADAVKQSNGGSSSKQSLSNGASEPLGTPDDLKSAGEVSTSLVESSEAETSEPEFTLASQPEAKSSNLQASDIEKRIASELKQDPKATKVVKEAAPSKEKRKTKKEKRKQATNDSEDEFEITEIEKKERKAKLILKAKFEFYLKDQPRIRNEEIALDNLPEKCSAIHDRVICSKELYSFEKYSPGIVQSFIDENRKRKRNFVISDNKKVRKHILPLFFTVISEMLDINAHRNWIHADVRHMMKHQEIYVYYRAATDYIGNIGWDRLERYMQRQYLVRRLGGNLKGVQVAAIERELMMAAKKNSVHHSIYTESDFFVERSAHYRKEFESSPQATLLHLYYVILGSGWHKTMGKEEFEKLVHVLNFDFFYLSQLSRFSKTDIGKKESDYFKMFFWV